MELSVIIPTFNRAQNLNDCIRRILNQEGMDEIEWELLIVDNKSTDHTAKLVAEFQRSCSLKIRYELETKQGVSYARNKGINSTKSRFLVFVDDDVFVDAKWLKNMYIALKQKQSDAVGGKILIHGPSILPKWISEDMRGFLGYLDFGDESFMMDGRDYYPFGANMAFNRCIFERIGLFDVRVGRRGEGRKRGELFKGEEPDLFRRVADAGGKIYYEPDAIVYHRILPHQLKKRYFRVLHFNEGFQKAFLSNDCYFRKIFGIPVFLFRQVLSSFLTYIGQVLILGPNKAFRQQMTFGYVIGEICGNYAKYSSNKN